MTARTALPVLLTAVTATMAGAMGCAGPASESFPRLPTSESHVLPSPDPDGAAWVDRVLESMSLEAAVGQLVFPWLSGAYAAEDDPEFLEAVAWVERWGIGGLAISIGTPHAYVAKLNALQGRSELPLLVTSDFENGGPGMRINHSYALPSLLPQGGGTSFPPTMAFGAIGDEDEVARFARVTAREARAVGVHVTFSPVLDVNSNPENPIINTRAFGESPAEVARLGRAYIRGAREGGVLTTAKHFPGHGDTRVDSHLELPEVTADRARLDAVELVPFAAAIDEGVDAVMTAHVSVPGVLGPAAPPATLSPEFMTGLLRDEMAFKGLLFTDALRMGAITDEYGAGEAAVLALEAGADVILIPESVGEAVTAVLDAVGSGRVSRARIDESVRRILVAKARLGLHEERMVPIEDVTRTVGVAEHLAAADRAAARSITLPRDREGLVPMDPDGVRRVLSVTYAVPEDVAAGREFDLVLAGLVSAVEGVRIGPGTAEMELEPLLTRAADFDVVLFNAYVPPRAGAGTVSLPGPVQGFVRTLGERHRTVLVSFGNPYLLNSLPEAGTYLVAWGDREVSQRAAARAVAGAAAIGGRLPITLPGLHERGAGLDRDAIPEVVARGDIRRDALDEAGLVRRSEEEAGDAGDAEVPPESTGDTLAVPGTPGGPGAFLPPATPPGGGAGQPSVPPGPLGNLAPSAWRTLTQSPLEVDPASVGMDPRALEELDDYILRALEEGVAPGAALAVGRRGQLVRLRGYGRLDRVAGSAPVTPFSLFDVASLTKVVATTTAAMLLAEEGRLSLEAPVVQYLPGFDRGDARKAGISIRDLLLHRSGLPAYRPFHTEFRGAPAIREAVLDLSLSAPPGTTTIYSDVGFMVLAWAIEAAAGEPLDAFLERRLFGPLGMSDTGFLPDPSERLRIAPTERGTLGRPYLIHGEVHDENAWAMGGIAGHAGLFSSAQDLAVFAQGLLDRGLLVPCEHRAGGGLPCGARSSPIHLRFLPESAIEGIMRRADPDVSRTLGWDTPSGRSSAGDYFSAGSFGHTGFTGTSIWIDPELELFVVLLTNRVYPTADNELHIPFRRAVHDAIATAVADRPVEPRER